MVLSIGKEELKKYIENQANMFCPDGLIQKIPDRAMEMAIFRMEYNFARINLTSYSDDDG